VTDPAVRQPGGDAPASGLGNPIWAITRNIQPDIHPHNAEVGEKNKCAAPFGAPAAGGRRNPARWRDRLFGGKGRDQVPGP